MNTQTQRAQCAVIVVSFCLLIVGIGNIPAASSEERFYIGAAEHFIAGTPSTNPEHPPFVKYILAGSLEVFGETPLGWRLPSVLAGTLLAFAIFKVVQRFTDSLRTAYVAWLLTIAGGFWYVMSRVALLPIFELAFEMTAIWLFTIAMRENNTKWWCYAGLLFGLSVASRWLGAMGLIACLIVAAASGRLRKPLVMWSTAVATYFITWIPLLMREHRPASYLITANAFILHYHRTAVAPAGVAEPWWKWLVLIEPTRSSGLFVANPLISALGLTAIVMLIWCPTRSGFTPPVMLYLAHILPWALSVRPSSYYYYYFEAFTFLVIVLAMALTRISWSKARLDAITVGTALIYFVYWYPAWGTFPEPIGGIFGYH